MIIKKSEATNMLCPIMSYRHEGLVNEPCRGSSCMAWRETYEDYGFCGMTNAGHAYTSKEDRQIEALWEKENDV